MPYREIDKELLWKLNHELHARNLELEANLAEREAIFQKYKCVERRCDSCVGLIINRTATRCEKCSIAPWPRSNVKSFLFGATALVMRLL